MSVKENLYNNIEKLNSIESIAKVKTFILFSAPRCIWITASISEKAPFSTSSHFPPTVSSAGVPITTIVPLKFSFNVARLIAAPTVLAAIQLCPQAWAVWFLFSP